MEVPVSFRRLLAVSHRGPLVIKKNRSGLSFSRSVSGLVSLVEPVIESVGGTWIAWCGRKSGSPGEEETWNISPENPRYLLKELSISPQEYREFYLGFSNMCLWPLCHNFVDRSVIDHRHWQKYHQVNSRFAAATAAEWEQGDMVWIHDYQLALMPQMLRDLRPGSRISFFWHIPFPPFEIFSILPWSREILEGLLGADSIAFHSSNYLENFLKCISYFLNVDIKNQMILWKGRRISLRFHSVGIDTSRFEKLARSPKVREKARAIRSQIGTEFLALGVDRMDYTKGIVERLQGVELFLEQNPGYRDRFTFLQVAVPTRTENTDYRQLRRLVEETVGRINGRFGNLWHVPLHYRFGSLNLEQLVAHYLAADLALITPLRDGLNLVAKEFVASKTDESGMLILSPFAGAAEQMGEAVIANPYYTRDLAEKILFSLEMDPDEKKSRMKMLRETVQREDLSLWWRNTLKSLAEAGTDTRPPQMNFPYTVVLNKKNEQNLAELP